MGAGAGKPIADEPEGAVKPEKAPESAPQLKQPPQGKAPAETAPLPSLALKKPDIAEDTGGAQGGRRDRGQEREVGKVDRDDKIETLDQFIGDTGSGAKYIRKFVAGKGAFGEASVVERAKDKKTFVAKTMNLAGMSSRDKGYAKTEILCLSIAKHFAVIQYVEHFVVDEDCIVIIMEYADHGDLYNNIKRHHLQLPERDAGIYFVQLLLALDCIHRRRMIHRDIKSANLFMTSMGLVKLGDFGFSQQYDNTVSGPIAATFLGTPYYLAPEMWRGNRYGKKADIWASGIVLFELLTTGRPYVAQNMQTLKEKVLSGTFSIPSTITGEMQDFVRLILDQDPVKRPSAQQLLRTPLMQHYMVLLEKYVTEKEGIPPEIVQQVKSDIAESQSAIETAIADEEAAGLVRHEGVVFKEGERGTWKTRYLALENNFLILSLAKGKEAVAGGDRSRKIPMEDVLSASPVDKNGIECGEKFAFAISTRTSTAIIMVTQTKDERDMWVVKILQALGMN
jgi:serine/threonine protein kinase